MDNNLLAIIIPAALALIGTVITVIVQMRQPKREKIIEGEAQRQAEKQAVYKELWERIEGVHVLVRRTDNLSEEEFKSQLADVNSLIMKQSLYVDKQDWDLTNRYLKTVRKFKELVDASGDAALQDDVASTGEYAADISNMISEIAESAEEVGKLRDELLARFQKIIIAKS